MRSKRASRAAAIPICAILLTPAAGVAADLAVGKALFNRCKICHAIEAGTGRKVGPNLHGIFGRKAGTSDQFPYSPAMKQSGVVWSDDTLRQYLENPRKFIPGNRMAFPGIKNDDELSALLAYLHQAAQ